MNGSQKFLFDVSGKLDNGAVRLGSTYFYELKMNLLLLVICIQVCRFEQLMVVPIFKVLDVF